VFSERDLSGVSEAGSMFPTGALMSVTEDASHEYLYGNIW